MHVILLGTAAGGGVPQWNCACGNCNEARRGGAVKPRTQDCVAVSADGTSWFLLNAPSDLATQIARHAALGPAEGAGSSLRGSPIKGVVLTNGDLDHCLGLLSLREWTPFSLYATRHCISGLVEYNAMFRTLSRQPRHTVHRPLELAERVPLLDADGTSSGLSLRAFSVPGKLPLHLEQLLPPAPDMNVGLLVESSGTGKRLAYVPGAATLSGIADEVRGVDCLLFDGTFWDSDELVRLGLSGKSAQALAHLPVGGAHGSLQALSRWPVERCIFVHINNTNPMLREDSLERASVEALGFGIAEDGVELWL